MRKFYFYSIFTIFLILFTLSCNALSEELPEAKIIDLIKNHDDKIKVLKVDIVNKSKSDSLCEVEANVTFDSQGYSTKEKRSTSNMKYYIKKKDGNWIIHESKLLDWDVKPLNQISDLGKHGGIIIQADYIEP